MKLVLLAACLAALCPGQQSTPAGRGVAPGCWDVYASSLNADGHIYHLRGNAVMKGLAAELRADSIDYDEDKAVVHLTGHVTIETDTVTLRAEDVDYDVHSGEMHSREGQVTLKLKQVPAR